MAVFTTEGFINALAPNEIFVFGSNLAGRHGKGAAKQALKWGAMYGVGRGLCGQTYAIPTKDEYLRTLNYVKICKSILEFTDFARKRNALIFYLTPVGCGLAGLDRDEMRVIFEEAGLSRNIIPWWQWPVTSVPV